MKIPILSSNYKKKYFLYEMQENKVIEFNMQENIGIFRKKETVGGYVKTIYSIFAKFANIEGFIKVKGKIKAILNSLH